MAQGLVHLTLLDENFIDAGLRPQGFDHRVAAFNEAVGLGGQLVFSFVCHIEILSCIGICQNLRGILFVQYITELRSTIKMNFEKSFLP